MMLVDAEAIAFKRNLATSIKAQNTLQVLAQLFNPFPVLFVLLFFFHREKRIQRKHKFSLQHVSSKLIKSLIDSYHTKFNQSSVKKNSNKKKTTFDEVF